MGIERHLLATPSNERDVRSGLPPKNTRGHPRSRSLGLAREGFLGGLGDVAAELAHVGLGDVLVLAVGAEDDPEPARHRRGGCGRMANDGARAEAARKAQGVCLFTAGLGRRPSVYRWSQQL